MKTRPKIPQMNQTDESDVNGKEHSGATREGETDGQRSVCCNLTQPSPTRAAHGPTCPTLGNSQRFYYILCSKQWFGEPMWRGGARPDAGSAPGDSEVGAWQRRDGAGGTSRPPLPPRFRSLLSGSARGLQQGACLKEAQLYLSGWKVRSRGRASWHPPCRTSSSAQGPSSVPGPSVGLPRHPETRSRASL